jgi:hypothetical protein
MLPAPAAAARNTNTAAVNNMTTNESEPDPTTAGDTEPAETVDIAAISDTDTLRKLEHDITGGQNWFLAVLAAIGRWQASEEDVDGRHYHYIISGEAFDWLLLAERLCLTVANLLPEAEMNDLIHRGRPPFLPSQKEFRELIGHGKYHQYLNYFYGITVEEAMQMAVLEEIRKEDQPRHLNHESETAEVYRRTYGSDRDILLKQFRQEQGYPLRNSIYMDELREFYYWLFKYRLRTCEKARIASDTKKGLDWLENLGHQDFRQ